MTMNAHDFAAKGDGQTDDTDAIQAALDAFSLQPASGVVTVPVGTYRISRPLVYRGSWPQGVKIRGELAAAGPGGSVLKWVGGEGTVLEITGCNACSVEGLTIDCGRTATTGIAVSYDHTRNQGTVNATVSHCHVGGLAGKDTAGIRIGYRGLTPDNYQCDLILVDRCMLVADGAGPQPAFGIATGYANAKNFTVRDCSIVGFGTGLAHGGSGFMQATGCFFQSNGLDVQGAGDTIELRSCNSEGSGRLFVGTMGKNPGSAIVANWTWDGKVDPGDETVIAYGGYLQLVGCQLWNRRTATSTCKVRCGPSQGAACSLDSSGNFFAQSLKQPFLDGSGNDVTVQQRFYSQYPAFIRSFGDYGGVPGALVPFGPLPGVVASDTLKAKDLVLTGSLDFGDGRKWTPEGLFLSKDRHWTDDGLYPGIGVKWVGAGGLVGNATNGTLYWVDWLGGGAVIVVEPKPRRNN